jgi:hypothetical protein
MRGHACPRNLISMRAERRVSRRRHEADGYGVKNMLTQITLLCVAPSSFLGTIGARLPREQLPAQEAMVIDSISLPVETDFPTWPVATLTGYTAPRKPPT